MLKRLTLITTVCLLAACGKSADDYVGYWREQSDRIEEVMEIKHENGNYFGNNLMGINNSLGMARKAVVLDEKDGVLSVQGVPFKLSDDGKSMYIGDRRLMLNLKTKLWHINRSAKNFEMSFRLHKTLYRMIVKVMKNVMRFRRNMRPSTQNYRRKSNVIRGYWVGKIFLN